MDKRKMSFDDFFYLPSYNLCIEFDGIQHFIPCKMFGGYEGYNRNVLNDKAKNDYCSKNKIKKLRKR